LLNVADFEEAKPIGSLMSYVPRRACKTQKDIDPSKTASKPTYAGTTSTSLNSLSNWLNTIKPRTTDSPTRMSPVVSRMALPRLPMLHLPGTYSGRNSSRFPRGVTSFICPLWYIDAENWRALPLSHLKRTTSQQPRPHRPTRSRDEP